MAAATRNDVELVRLNDEESSNEESENGSEDDNVVTPEQREQTLQDAGALELPVGVKIGCAAGALVISGGVFFALDAAVGALARDRYRREIHKLVPHRVAARTAELQAEKLLTLVTTLNLNIAEYQGIDGVTPDQLRNVAMVVRDDFEKQLALITPERAEAELAAVDEALGAWTNEDH